LFAPLSVNQALECVPSLSALRRVEMRPEPL
jgi:hypothetical protein